MTSDRSSSLWLRWRTIVMAFEDDPIYLMAVILLVGAIGIFASILLGLLVQWPYQVLFLSLCLGAAALFLVRETIAPTPKTYQARYLALIVGGLGLSVWLGLLRELSGR
jgi:predicted membrane channel-forming protein YqfA (hemolysin III family)